MKYGKIAVISQNTELLNFYRAELLYRGFEAYLFSSFADIKDGYIMCIVDTDSCKSFGEIDCTTVSISSRFETQISKSSCLLAWPTKISDIDKLFNNLLFGDKPTASSNDDISIIADDTKQTVLINGRLIGLTANEFAIIKELCLAEGKTVKRERIMEMLEADSGNISEVYIHHLRKKLERDGKRLIFTERGVGYYTHLRLKSSRRLPIS